MPILTKKPKSPLLYVLKNNPEALQVPKEGEVIEAIYLGRNNKAAYFDLGKKGIGIVYGIELINAQDDIKELKIGSKSLVKVIEPENDDGYAELSLKETKQQKNWERVQELKESDEPLTVTITNANSGGLLTEIEGLAAFLPVSQLASEHYPQVNEGDRSKILEELKKFIGQKLQVKILEAEPRSNKLILSEKIIAAENIKTRLEKYKVGDVIDGIVTGIADFGVFIQFANDPEIEGLIHISELDHRLIENPKKVVKINDVVKAKIIEIKDGKVSLSLKALKENPWEKVAEKYKAGQEVQGSINRFNPFGAVVDLDQDIQGLIHVSEFGSIEAMKQQLKIGEKHTFRIELVKPEEKRIILKLKK